MTLSTRRIGLVSSVVSPKAAQLALPVLSSTSRKVSLFHASRFLI